MTQYKYTVGATPQSVVGNLTWNANGSLAQLAITDPFNSANAQTCGYSHDDLARIASANCGTAANQTFTFDAFGNIDKSGSPYSFLPSYNTATNRISLVGGSTPSYDANGNITNDFLNAYAWDANGRPVTVTPYGGSAVGMTYDALGRMVEQGRGSSYTQVVYDPTGNKLALLNGSTVAKVRVPLPSGGRAVYTGSGLAYYTHADWLGSERFFSTPSQTMYGDVAYAPFGETYASSGTPDVSFTGQNSDTVSGDYDFLFREYSIQGRWVSPDPAGMAAVDPTDPQSWNRYAYVGNKPFNSVDPLGLRPCGIKLLNFKELSWGDCGGAGYSAPPHFQIMGTLDASEGPTLTDKVLSNSFTYGNSEVESKVKAPPAPGNKPGDIAKFLNDWAQYYGFTPTPIPLPVPLPPPGTPGSHTPPSVPANYQQPLSDLIEQFNNELFGLLNAVPPTGGGSQ